MGTASIILLVIILMILIVLSYFFSAAETAFTASSIAKLNKLNTVENGFRASTVIKLKNKKEQVIGAILIGNNVFNILASSISSILAFDLFGSTGAFISGLTISLIIIIFAEVLPKTYALNNPEKMALFAGSMINYSTIILTPIIKFVVLIVNLMLKPVNKDDSRESIHVFEALRNLIVIQNKNDINDVNKSSLEVITSMLDLMEIHVSQIMTHRKDIFSINVDLSQKEILKQALSSSYSYIPLWKDDPTNIIAIINTNALFYALKSSAIEQILLDDVVEKPIFILDKTPISTQLHNFKKTKTNFAVIQDEYGEMKGIVTLSDIIEEIFGEVYTYDKHNECIKNISKNCYSIDGRAHIRDINRVLKWNLPYKNAATVAGMIMYALEKVPKKDEEFSLYGYNFKIISASNTSVYRVIVEKFD